jgi:hypothetical protein
MKPNGTRRRALASLMLALLATATWSSVGAGATDKGAVTPKSVGSSTIALSPTPIAATGTLAAGATVDVTLQATNSTFGCGFFLSPGCDVWLSFDPTQGGGQAYLGSSFLPLYLTSTPTKWTTDNSGNLTIHYKAPGILPAGGTDTLTAQNGASSATVVTTDTYIFSTAVSHWVFSPSPIAANGSLAGNATVNVTLTSENSSGGPVSYAGIDLSFEPTAGGGTASVGSTALSSTAQRFTSDGNGHIAITYHTPGSLPAAGGKDLIRASELLCIFLHCTRVTLATDTYTYATHFYFAEGTTRSGFAEKLSLLMPNDSGTATVTYYFADGSASTNQMVSMTAGQVSVVDVNAFVGADKDVSASVSLPGAGVAERTMNFNIPGVWHGSHDKVGVNSLAFEWNFAEGSTLSVFSEYLTLQNPSPFAAHINLNYITDTGATVTKSLVLAAGSRSTVEVFKGNMTAANPCIPNGVGANCGVGPGFGGVSVQVQSIVYCIIPSVFGCLQFGAMPIVAERPMYVNNFGFSFPSGTIADGDVAFGATAAAADWKFAEGTTLSGFREYLTLQNNNAAAATVSLTYLLSTGVTPPVKTLTIPANTRVTVEVWNGDTTSGTCHTGAGANCGVGSGIGGVSVNVHSDQPIVAERPIYIMQDFGSGTVAGSHDVVGSTGLGTNFGFSAGSTLAGENDYLTIQNPQAAAANITLTYYGFYCPRLCIIGTAWFTATKTFTVAANSRQTVEVANGDRTDVTGCLPNGAGANCGVGGGVSPLGVTVSSNQQILVERPTYNSTSAAYGATDTQAFQPPSGF